MTGAAPAGFDWPSAHDALRVLTLRAHYNSVVVVVASALLGLAAGVVGTFALLRQRALMADALAHATLPGIATAFLVSVALGAPGKSRAALLVGATVTGVLAVLLVQWIIRHTRLREDAAIAVVLGVSFALGIVLLSYLQSLPTGTQGGLNHYIYGQPAAMSRQDAALMGGAALLATTLTALLFRHLRLVCFDDRFAASIGSPVPMLDLLIMTLVVLVTVIGLQAVGLILVVSLLVIPPAAARFWTERLGVMVPLAGAIGAAAGYLGASASALGPSLPAGAVIVLTAGALFLVSLLVAPRRGLLRAAARHGALRLAVARDHYLRAAYELAELRGSATEAPLSRTDLARVAGLSRPALAALTAWLRLRGDLRRLPSGVALTPRGARAALRLTRNHRLWEEYLLAHADIAPSHVDRSADRVEHILSPALVAELEATLRGAGRLPGDGPTPSRHPLALGAAVRPTDPAP
ncbi:MAG TPA: iron chelate uptake ABC transporter family permease subunit [Phycisphaerales bacterium]|nr:iron chelate uptake ABC transporter family permease subunit [Phycisphaerales bacterium]